MQSGTERPLRTATPNTRFHVLDGIRGIAALAIVFHHYLNHEKYPFVTNSYVAVDLFFMLSGFVIYHSYARKLQAGMSVREFLNARYSRLAPMVAMGVLAGAIAALIMAVSDGVKIDLVRFALTHAGHVLFIPDLIGYYIPSTGVTALFPSNIPLWSIFFEFVASIAFIWLLRLPRWALIVGSLTSLALLVLGCADWANVSDELLFTSASVGSSRDTFLLGFPRLFASFIAGMVIYSLSQDPSRAVTRRLPVWKGLFPAIAIYAAVLAILCFPSELAGLYPFLAISLFCPLLITFGARMAPSSRWFQTLSDWLGQLSFPIYCIHVPIRELAKVLYADVPGWMQIVLSVFLSVLTSVLLLLLLNRLKARQRLSRLLLFISGRTAVVRPS